MSANRQQKADDMGQSKSSFIHQDHESRITRLEVFIENVNNSLIEIKTDIRRLDTKIDATNNRIDSNFKWLLGMMIGGFASVLAVVAHAQHWI